MTIAVVDLEKACQKAEDLLATPETPLLLTTTKIVFNGPSSNDEGKIKHARELKNKLATAKDGLESEKTDYINAINLATNSSSTALCVLNIFTCCGPDRQLAGFREQRDNLAKQIEHYDTAIEALTTAIANFTGKQASNSPPG